MPLGRLEAITNCAAISWGIGARRVCASAVYGCAKGLGGIGQGRGASRTGRSASVPEGSPVGGRWLAAGAVEALGKIGGRVVGEVEAAVGGGGEDGGPGHEV